MLRNPNKVFPDYFYSKGPVQSKVEALDYGDGMIRWFNVVEGGENANKTYINMSSARILAPYEDNDEGLIDCGDLEETYDIVTTKSGKFMTSFYVPPALLSVIVGPRGSQLKQLQENTRTLIKVPRPDEPGDVKVTGHSERSVASARNQISMIILNKREKMPVTHFVSIPALSQAIEDNFIVFKKQILSGPPTRGIDESVFQKPEKFHLTIATLTLLDEIEINDAKTALKNCYQEVIEPLFPRGRMFRVTMKGVEIMNDDPSDVDVLYGKVKLDNTLETENFQLMANGIANYFYKKGLIRKQYDNVKLHVTLMNSLFRKKYDNYEKIEERSRRESFDATEIIQKYSNFFFGTFAFETVHLSTRFSTGSNKYYESALTISIFCK